MPQYEYKMTLMLKMGILCMQASYFLNSAPEQIEYAKNRYLNETDRLYQVSRQQLMATPQAPWPARGGLHFVSAFEVCNVVVRLCYGTVLLSACCPKLTS